MANNMWPLNILRFTKSKYRNSDAEYPTIQQLLKDNWFTSETGIVKGLSYKEAFENKTHGQGNIRADYATLKKIFGKPSVDNKNGRGSKIRKEWIISIDGVICRGFARDRAKCRDPSNPRASSEAK